MEERVIQWLKGKHRRKMPIGQLIREMKLTPSERLELLGSVKYFTHLHRNYQTMNNQVICLLEVV